MMILMHPGLRQELKPLVYRKENCTQHAETVKNPHVKRYYKRYCNIPSKVIKEAKKCHYDNQIKHSANKNKTTWDIVNKETHRKTHSTNIKSLNIDGITTDNQQLTAETFNNYFTSIAENIKTTDRNAYIQNKNTPDTVIIDISAQYAKEMKKLRCTTIQSKRTTTSEIENIIKTLKPRTRTDTMKSQLNY